LADQRKAQNAAGAELRIEFWRLRTYSFGFVAAFLLHLAMDGIERPPVLLSITVLTLSVGLWVAQGPWLRNGVMLGIVHALVFPIVQQTIANGESIVAIVARTPIWPQLLVTLIGSRVLVTEGELSFAQFWRRPTRRKPAIEIHSVPSAIALGSFLTLAFYLCAHYALPPSTKQTSGIVVSAMLGGTIVHSAIVFLFFVILSSILHASQLYLVDRSILAVFGRLVEEDRKAGATRELASILFDKLYTVAHTRAFRLLNAAIEAKASGSKTPSDLAILSFGGFHFASRHFVRALLTFLPLLGFLGTVIGLAIAISELPHGITEGGGQALDISASLAGLAVKFETTLLGLVASMICSLSLGFLEKREAELAATCMLIVKDAGERNA
jgi:MotA/TolQ/ExbB proton channel family protein